MSDLKTLKDIEIEYEDKGKQCFSSNDLRAEAIKWVKNANQREMDNFVMTFFNLTEDDLK